MKKMILSMAVMAATLVATPATARTFGFGVTGGLNVSKLDCDNAKNNDGWYAGLTAKVTVPLLGFGVDGSLLYSYEKAGINGNTTDAQFLSIPVNLRYDFQLPVVSKVLVPYAFLGPQFDYALNNGKIETGKGGSYKLKDSVWKANFGVGALLLNHLQISYAYSLPLTKSFSFDSLTEQADNAKLSTHKIGVAYFF